MYIPLCVVSEDFIYRQGVYSRLWAKKLRPVLSFKNGQGSTLQLVVDANPEEPGLMLLRRVKGGLYVGPICWPPEVVEPIARWVEKKHEKGEPRGI